MNVASKLSHFLQDNELILRRNDMESLWKAWQTEGDRYEKDGSLVDCLLEAGIDPLHGMDYIPECFMLSNSKITTFIIPDYIKEIHSRAFVDAPLKEITIGKGVTNISQDCFIRCHQLSIIRNNSSLDVENMDFAHNATVISSSTSTLVDGDFEFAKVGSTHRLIRYTGSDSKITLPSAAAGQKYEVANGALVGVSAISNLVGVSKFYADTFDSSISRVDVDSLNTWASIAFEYASANPLWFGASLYVGGRKLVDLADWKNSTIPAYAFANWREPELIIPEGVVTIENGAFQGARGDTLILPTSLESVEKGAFNNSAFKNIINNSKLVVLPGQYSGAYSCGGAAFEASNIINQGKSPVYSTSSYQADMSGNTALAYRLGNQPIADLSLPENIKGKPLELLKGAFQGTGLRKLHLPDSLKCVPANCFADNPKLTEIWWGKGIEVVSSRSFSPIASGCKVYISDLEAWCCIDWEDELSNPGRYLYLNDKPLTDLQAPQSLVELPYRAFARCQSLQKVVIPEGYRVLGQSVFSMCFNLTSVSLPSSIKTIQPYCFYRDLALTEIQYEGTKHMWTKVNKAPNWKKGSGINVVHCCDGDVAVR